MEVTGPISARQPSAFSEVQHLGSTFGHRIPALHSALALAPRSRAVQMQGRRSLLRQPPGYILQDTSPSQGRQGGQAQRQTRRASSNPAASGQGLPVCLGGNTSSPVCLKHPGPLSPLSALSPSLATATAGCIKSTTGLLKNT